MMDSEIGKRNEENKGRSLFRLYTKQIYREQSHHFPFFRDKKRK